MIELLTTMSLTQVVIISFLILIAVKEIFSLYDFFKKKIKKSYDEETTEKDMITKIHDKVMELESNMNKQQECQVMFKEKLQFLEENARERTTADTIRHEQNIQFQDKVSERLDKQQEILTLLTESDRDDIKSWIVQQFHYFYETKGWIDDFSMDSIEKRYTWYQQEGGNSYVTSMVKQLRTLPRRPIE